MNIEYIEMDGIFYPKIEMQGYKKLKNVQGKFPNARLNYLKNEEEDIYNFLLHNNNLERYLKEIEIESREKVENLIEKIKKRRGINEKMKEENQMKWVGEMNNIKRSAEEIVMKSLRGIE